MLSDSKQSPGHPAISLVMFPILSQGGLWETVEGRHACRLVIVLGKDIVFFLFKIC